MPLLRVWFNTPREETTPKEASMANSTSVRVPDFIPAEPELLSPVAKGLLRLIMATGSLVMLGAFLIVTAIAVF